MIQMKQLPALCCWLAALQIFACGDSLGQISGRPSATDRGANRATIADDTRATISRIIEAGREYEGDERWAEALSLYQQALRQHPKNSSLKQRRAIARIHFELERRYADNSFIKTIGSSSSMEALNLYAEVLLKVDSYHVDQPDWPSLVRHGLASFEIAINDPSFRKRNLPKATDQQVSEMIRWTRQAMENYVVRNRQDAFSVARSTARTAQSRLGVPIGITTYEFISGAIVALDTYSSFLSQSQYGETMSQIEGSFVGLGVELKTSNNELEIVSVIAKGPAGQSGIMGGDKIVSIDNQLVANVGSEKAADMLRGAEGSWITMQVITPSDTERSVRLQRRRVAIPSVESVRIVDPESGIGYIRVTNFQKTTTHDFDAALWKLQRQGMKSLIVDVRGNPGGLLNSSVEMADRFIGAGVIVSTKGRNPLEDYIHRAKAPGTWKVPLVVLIDENSASASEIFAAAINDHHRGVVVGQRSYGKGSVQGIFPLNISGGGIRLTTAKFYSPKGNAISERGVFPEVKIEIVAKPNIGSYTAEDTDAILRTGIQVARKQLLGEAFAGR